MKTFTHITIFILFLASSSVTFCSSDFLSKNRITRSIQDDKKRGVIKQISQVQQNNHEQSQNNSAQQLPDWQKSLLIIEPFNKYAKKNSMLTFAKLRYQAPQNSEK